MLYFAFVYPHLLYGIEIYGNTNLSNTNGLKILNNKILRILQKRPRCTHIIDLYKSYSTLPIDLLHKYQILLFVHKFAHHSNKLPLPLISPRTSLSIIMTLGTSVISICLLRALNLYLGKVIEI